MLLEPRLYLSATDPNHVESPPVSALVAPAAENFRYATSSNTIYVSGPVIATLTDVHTFLPNAPLAVVDQVMQVWKLDANLILQEGATLQLHGQEVGGDVDELRLKSNNVVGGPAVQYVELRADWGNTDVHSTKIISWDDAVAGPDTEYVQFGRAFVRARSRLGTDGVTPLESRMDIVDSEVAYLGFDRAESYGLVWKVAGTTPGILDAVNVMGDVTNSFLHHNFFGMYTYGHFGGQWTFNEVANNVKYGIDPHDDSDYLLIANNYVHHNGTHGIIASKRCDHVTIRDNISSYNVGNGIMLHILSDDSLIEGNTTEFNGDSGISLYDSHRVIVRDNTSSNNRRGIRLSVGSSENLIEENLVSLNTDLGLYLYQGTDPAASGNSRPHDNIFRANHVENNGAEALYLQNGDDNTVENNVFGAGTAAALRFRDGEGNVFRGNTLPDEVALRITGRADQLSSVTVSAQRKLNVKVDAFSSVEFIDVAGAVFETQESGLASQITPTGSRLALDFANTGGDTVVSAAGLTTSVSGGQLAVDPLEWDSGGQALKRFTAQAAVAGQSADFVVSGLQAGETYVVSRNGLEIGQSVADVDGRIALTAVFNSTALDTFRFEMGSPPPPPPAANTASEAESFTRRVDGAPSSTPNPYRWFVVTSETPGVGSFTGATGSFVQALRSSDGSNVSGKNLAAPATPYVEYDLNVPTAGVYQLEIRAAGLSTSSDSVWVEVLGATNTQGATRAQVGTNSTGQFTWFAGGKWNLAAGAHTVRVSMRESGAALDAVRLVDTALPPPPPIPAPSGVIEAETYTRRVDGPPPSTPNVHRWFVVPSETAATANFVGPVGPFLQALQASDGANSGAKSLTTPTAPYVEYDVNIVTAGVYQLDLRAAGLNGSSDSLWVEVLGATRVDGSGPLQLSTNTSGQFAWFAGGKWNLMVGTYTLRVSMREAGAALDAFRLVLQQ
jgi:parallel beta-helix repeat protein